MTTAVIILSAILLIIVLFNLRKIGSFLYAITIFPWELLFSGSTSTGNGAGMFAPIAGFFAVGIQLIVLGGLGFGAWLIWG